MKFFGCISLSCLPAFEYDLVDYPQVLPFLEQMHLILRNPSEEQNSTDPSSIEEVQSSPVFVIVEPIAFEEILLQPEEEPDSHQPLPSEALAALSADRGIELGINAFQTVLDPKHKTGLYAEVVYPVKRIFKKMGDRFEEDEPLVTLEDQVTKGNFHQAEAAVDKAEAELWATQELFREKLASLFELKKAEADAATARAEMIKARKNLEACCTKAPYTGVVESVYIEEHELPQTTKEMIKILDDSILVAKLLIPSYLLKEIAAGTPLHIRIEETEEIVEAHISRVGGMIDPASSTIRIEAEIPNPDRRLKPGMTGIATFNKELWEKFP